MKLRCTLVRAQLPSDVARQSPYVTAQLYAEMYSAPLCRALAWRRAVETSNGLASGRMVPVPRRRVAGTGSFAAGFIVAAVVLAIGIICYVALLGRIEQIQMPGPAER